MELGEKIRNIRKSKNMTLEQLGEKVGVGKSTVRKWENGMISNMRQDKIAKLADALGTTPSFLMGWKEPDPTKRIKRNTPAEELAKEFDVDVDRLDTILNLAKRWKEEIGEYDLNESETQDLLDYAKFIISKRREAK